MEPTVSLSGVGKRYVKYDDVPLLISHAFRMRAGNKRSHFWALREIDLAVGAGESFGVIGRNGSGKSTMFRMLAGVTAPTEGMVSVRGRVAPLISVGIGFHPELTGRENVYVNGIILGMTRKEIDKRFDAILDFAEIHEFIDTPVKFYSSGMFVRLGFSVAVAADPEVLLVDEVLAVGDLAFQIRCYDRMEEIRRDGATVLVVSHNMNAIRRLCSRTMVLHDGKHLFTGETDEAVSLYNDLLGNLNIAGAGETAAEVQILEFTLLDAKGKVAAHVAAGDEVTFRMLARYRQAVERPVFGFRMHKDTGQEVYSENSVLADHGSFAAGETVKVDFRMRAALPTSSYIVKATAWTGADKNPKRAVSDPLTFFVSGRPFVKETADLGLDFDVSRIPAAQDGKPPTEAPLAHPSGH
ncbi:MAG: ABC transporter ATP-binding protein [Actinobacteria bacterium]|nr:MAG: ABC transporter ATP-binding protein [Actinomycetota bacterium]